jgi:translation initiation factor IF-3
LKINRAIRAAKVRVIDAEGNQAGILDIDDALKMAEDANLDLVEIAQKANPPVCKIIDYSKFRYQQVKKEKTTKKSSHQVKIKEVKFKPNIDVHDLNTKIKRIKDFLNKGYKVRVTVTFRGREMLHLDLGEKVVRKVYDEVEELAQIEVPIKQMGRIMSTSLAPLTIEAKNKILKNKKEDQAKDDLKEV